MDLKRSLALALGLLTATSQLALAQTVGDDDQLPQIETYIFETKPTVPGPDFVKSLKVPAGYSISVFAKDLGNARYVEVAENGDIYINRNSTGDVIRLRDRDGDGVADEAPEVVAKRPAIYGVTVHENKLYAASAREIFVADIAEDGKVGELQRIVKDLPDSGQHYNRSMKVGPDGWLYVQVGSTCNTCNESSQESAALLRVSPDGKQRSIVATGLRDAIGYGWHPITGELWTWDQGIDYLGNDLQQEEVNKVEFGKRYGWPYVMEDGKEYPQLEPQGGLSNAEWAKSSTNPALMYTAHSAGMEWAFHPGGGRMGDEVANDAFVALRGSWNRKPASGYEVVRVRFDGDGQATKVEPFITGFLSEDGTKNYGRLVGMAIAKDGALLFSDDTNGILYRVVKDGASADYVPKQVSADWTTAQTSQGTNVALANARPETAVKSDAKVDVSSPAFAADGDIPLAYTEYGQGISIPLKWNRVEGAVSYAIITEDPDAPQKPTVHWVAWNIPAATVELPEALPERDRLDGDTTKGIMQGRGSANYVAYRGPRPPVGDPAHHYHIQVLALDKMLDAPLGANRDEILNLVKGHVIAKGELVGKYAQTSEPMN